jgi:hypothetical protein
MEGKIAKLVDRLKGLRDAVKCGLAKHDPVDPSVSAFPELMLVRALTLFDYFDCTREVAPTAHFSRNVSVRFKRLNSLSVTTIVLTFLGR